MDTDRFAKLAELRQKGLITEAEYEHQKAQLFKPVRLQPRWRRWGWKIVAFLFLVWLVIPRGSGGFPTCEASVSRELVRQAIEEGTDARTVNTRLLALDEIRQLSDDPKGLDRTCAGRATLNGGEHRIVWHLYQRGSNVFVDVAGL
jgi:hypothetical protein